MLKERAILATYWSAAEVLVRQALQFGVSIALARLLSPEEFGTIASLFLFIGLAGTFADSGFASALIQCQDVTHTDESTVFWFNAAVGAMGALGLWAAAPLIAGVFSLPILVPLTSFMALNIFLSALGSVNSTVLTKRLDFRAQMKVSAVATVISGGIAVVMALRGYGVWALATQSVVASGTMTAGLWVVGGWRPALVFSRASMRRLFRFGGFMLASSLLEVVYSRLYTVLIGKVYGVRDLGFYNRADTTEQLPLGMMANVMSRVLFPTFSVAANDAARLRRGMQLAVRSTILLSAPMMLGLAAVSESLVLTLFGVRWLPAVQVLQVLCLGGVFWPLHVLNVNVLMAQGHSRLLFRLDIAKKSLALPLLGIGTLFGIVGIAWSQAVFNTLGLIINAYYTKIHLDYGVQDQLRDSAPVLAVALPMAGVVYWFGTWLHLPPLLELSCLSTLGLLIFVIVGFVFRLAALRDSIDLFRRRGPAVPEGKYSP